MAESPQERSPGVFSRIGSWLSWGWGSPVLSGDEPTSETQREEASDEDHRETSLPTAGAHETDSPAVGETVPAEKSPSLRRNAKHLISFRGGGDGTGERTGGAQKAQVCLEKTSENRSKRSQSFESHRRRSSPDISDQDKTEKMGRRRSGRRRRSSHGDLGGSQTKSPTNTHPDSPAATSLATSPQTACADSVFEEAENSALECSGAEEPNSGSREDVVRAEWVEAHLSEDAADSPISPDPPVHATLAFVADSDMDEEPVVRLTESAESKRRSLKVSHSEKIFAKKVVVTSEDPNEDHHEKFKITTDPKRPRSDERVRCPEDRVDGTNVKSGHQKGRIADKISLFERGANKAASSSTSLHHLDISPARNVANRLTEHAGRRPSSAPPKQTVKERAMNFTAGQRGDEKLTLSSGVSSHTLKEGHSKTAGRQQAASCSGSFEKSNSGELKPVDQTDSKSHNATQRKPALSESISDSNIGNKELDSVPTVSSPTDETPQVKSPNRTSSRSKKRRSKDTAQPLSPTSKNKQETGQGKQEVKHNTAPDIDLKPLVDAEDVCMDQSLKSTSGEEVSSKKTKFPRKLEKAADIMQSTETTSNTDSKRSQKAPHMDSKGLKEMKSVDEKERENTSYFEAQIVTTASKASSSQTENSSNEVKIERTGIDSEQQKNSNKKQPVQESSEGEQGEGWKNRDTIVNTLFGESGKLDPSVTKEEKPPSPEDLKAANSKDSFEPANSSTASSRKDAMRNRESETDMLVLPEKDTTRCVHKAKNTPENDPKSDETQRPSKPSHKSKEKDCLAEITNQSKKKCNVTEASEQLKTTETHKHSNEVNTSKQNKEGETTTKPGKSKDTSAVKPNDGRQEDTTITQNTSTELYDQTKEKDASTSRALATPNPALVKKQNDEMDTIISPQIPPTEGGGPKRGGPPPKSQSENREEQKTQTASSKTDLQQRQQKPGTETTDGGTNKTKSKVTSTEITSIVNGDINSVETEEKIPSSSHENTFPVIPPNNENLSLRSAKKKPTSLSSTSNEASTEHSGQASEKITSKPASTNETASSLPASNDDKNTTCEINSTILDSANEKTTPPPASTNETISPLPASTNEKTMPPPASTIETTSPLPASTNEKTTPPQASTNETISPLPASTNEKTMPPPASTIETTSPLPASTNEMTTPPAASTIETISPLPASTNEMTTPPPASTIETISASLGSSDDMKKPPPASTNENKTTPSDSINEITTPQKATPPPASTNEVISSLPATTNIKITPPSDSANRKTSDETTTHSLASTNEKITHSPDSSNEKAKPPPASTNETTSTLLAQTNENTTPPTASANEKATPLPASTIEITSTLLGSTNEKTTPSPSSTDKSTSTLGSGEYKTTPPLVLTDETAKYPLDSSNEETTASTNETISRLLVQTNENTMPPTASANEKATLLPASTNETTSTLPASSHKKTTSTKSSTKEHAPPPAKSDSPFSKDKTTKNERTSPPPPPPPPASSFPLTSTSGENITPLPSSKEKTVSPPEYNNGKTPPSPASVKEKTLPPHASTIEKISHTLPSASEKSPSPSSKSTDPATRKKEFAPKPFHLPQIPSAPGSSSLNRDSPSSWLDVDYQRPKRKKQLISEPKSKLNTSVSETNLDTSGEFDPDDFVANVKRLAMPFNLPQRKHNQHRLQAPPFVLPAIREDRFEKPFDPEEFQHGLRKRREFILDLDTSSISKSQDTEAEKENTKPKWTKPERESILTRSLIFQRAKKKSETDEGEKKELSDVSSTEPLKTRSRLERCSIVSALRSPSKLRRMEFLSPTECPSDGLFSPSDAPGSTSPPQSQLVPTAKSPEQIMLGEVLAKNDGRSTPSGSGTPDLKTTSRKQTVTMVIDTNAPPSDTQACSQVVLKPTKEDGPTSLDPQATMLTDTNSPPTPSCTQSGSQVVLKHTKDDRPTMTPDLKIPRDPTVTMLTDTNALLHPSGTQNTSQVVLKPTKDDGLTPKPDQKTTSADPTVTKVPPLLSNIQTGSDVVLKPDGPTLMPDLKTTTVDPTATMVTDASAPPPLPSFEDIKLPSILEKFLPKEPEATRSSNKIDPMVARESASIPGLVDLNTAVDIADRKTQEVTIPPAPQVSAAQILQREIPNIPTARGIHRRPAKIVIFEHHQFNGQSFEFYRDQPDATQMQLSSVISVKVVRGCWILYEKPGFEGRCIALEEERVVELPNQWAEEGEETSAPIVIGSIRLAVRDYTPPRIELFTEPTGMGRSSEYEDVTEEVGSFGLPQNTGSIKVHSGLWLVYSDPGFQGLLAVLETGEYPFPEDWGFPIVGSLRPLRMGLPKVENPAAVKAVLYEKAGLEGRCVEVHGDVFSFGRTETDPDDHGLNCVESLKILGGLWVGYEREGFDGQQFILEEGEYVDWRDWGGTGQKLLSLRPVLMDFSPPHMKMFSELDFSERGVSIDLLDPLENVANTHYGPQTGSIEVLAGVWVAFEEPGLCGQQYVLEKGLYGSPEDWGASDSRISSAIPVTLENLENSCHFQIQLFSEPGFSGTSVLLQDSLPTMPEGFTMCSCRVFAGSWLAFSRECFSGHQCVLEEGVYPNLKTMGFTQPDTSVLSIQPAGHEFSLPSIVLFERSGLKGRRTLLKSSSVNLQLTDSCTRVSSILVEGGMWVLYEASNFRGSQFLLKPGAIPDWAKLSSWLRIGSLRPLMQKQTLFRLRNEEAGLLMSVIGSLDDIKLMRIQVSEETDGPDQIWAYQDGRLHCKWLLDCCVDVGSGVLMPGARAVLSSEPEKPQQLWNITSDGIIRSNAAPNLVLEVKGGQQFDKRQIILNEFHPNKMNQRWSLEIL
ncbi:beta/gamma crystallin domain-containing protein 1 [Chanodichthys erythropterus]|uniref:beta/gamma crystallin domain-containing protein 1 n=1 Tax=Chanodichthys erythropterus TaxID=933992 RepID=UPI00351F0189